MARCKRLIESLDVVRLQLRNQMHIIKYNCCAGEGDPEQIGAEVEAPPVDISLATATAPPCSEATGVDGVDAAVPMPSFFLEASQRQPVPISPEKRAGPQSSPHGDPRSANVLQCKLNTLSSAPASGSPLAEQANSSKATCAPPSSPQTTVVFNVQQAPVVRTTALVPLTASHKEQQDSHMVLAAAVATSSDQQLPPSPSPSPGGNAHASKASMQPDAPAFACKAAAASTPQHDPEAGAMARDPRIGPELPADTSIAMSDTRQRSGVAHSEQGQQQSEQPTVVPAQLRAGASPAVQNQPAKPSARQGMFATAGRSAGGSLFAKSRRAGSSRAPAAQPLPRFSAARQPSEPPSRRAPASTSVAHMSCAPPTSAAADNSPLQDPVRAMGPTDSVMREQPYMPGKQAMPDKGDIQGSSAQKRAGGHEEAALKLVGQSTQSGSTGHANYQALALPAASEPGRAELCDATRTEANSLLERIAHVQPEGGQRPTQQGGGADTQLKPPGVISRASTLTAAAPPVGTPKSQSGSVCTAPPDRRKDLAEVSHQLQQVRLRCLCLTDSV